MRRNWRSLNLKLPALMTGLVVVITAVFFWSALRLFDGMLRDMASARLSSSATLLARLIQDGVPAARAAAARLATTPEVRDALTMGADSATVARALRDATLSRSASADSALLRIRLLDTAGIVRHVVQLRAGAVAAPWAEGARTRGALSPTTVTFSPVLDVHGRAQAEYVIPVHARSEGESLIGYIVETRAIRGRGADAIRTLIGTSTLLFGQPDEGVWSDLEFVVPGPPPITQVDSVIVFDASPRGGGIGVSRSIRGTPWVIWLQLSHAQMREPLDAFLMRLVPLLLLIAALGAVLAWWYSRRMTGRIVRLTTLVDGMANAARDTDTRVAREYDGRDEIDRLEASFRLMAKRAEAQQHLEAQLLQSQKLEAVGRLAGGIAHDFNNILTVVTNFSEIVQHELEPDSPAARDVDQIIEAANRAARLTRQLLAFSRRQILQPVRLDLNEVVRSAHRMLERLIPSRVNISIVLDARIAPVMADPVQIEQVLLNLAVNASDAMPDGGTLEFSTMMAELDDNSTDVIGVTRDHVCLVVKDSGVGMDRETSARIFEPFFTTKPIGKGTGLGLATVHGIVTQLGGRVWVYSEPGHGTTFKLFLPTVDGDASPVERTQRRVHLAEGAGTVLLVEDDPGTREVTRRLLARQGYTVIESDTADHALQVIERDRARVQLVLTDVMMPGMNGLDLARLAAVRWPDLPLLLMSGYSDAEFGDLAGTSRFTLLEKPFTSTTLLGAVAHALAEAGAGLDVR